jgi:hypothetical protein
MEAKSVLYAAVGAPVVAARKVSAQMTSLKGKVDEQTSNYSKSAEKVIEEWAAEGEKTMTRISEGKVVEEISSKVDLDQAKEQVSKLRDQLEDMLATWRTSFRPEKAEGDEAKGDEAKGDEAKGDTTPTSEETAPEEPAAEGATTDEKPAAAKTSSAKTTKTSTATKTSSTKTETANAETAS